MNKTVQHILVAAAGFASLPLIAVAVLGAALGYLGSFASLLLLGLARAGFDGAGDQHAGLLVPYALLFSVSALGVFASWLLVSRLKWLRHGSGESVVFVVACGWSLGFASWLAWTAV